MNSIQLIKSKKTDALYGIMSYIFVLCGGNFYMNYILPTNPQSRNKLIRKLWGGYAFKDPAVRYYFAYVYGTIHLIGLGINMVFGTFWGVSNILINLYPVIVQLYVGYRCWRIKDYYTN